MKIYPVKEFISKKIFITSECMGYLDMPVDIRIKREGKKIIDKEYFIRWISRDSVNVNIKNEN